MLGNKGFTLMEVLVVVAIIGLLAAIAVPNYIHALEQSRDEVCAANIQIVSVQVERYKLTNGELPEPGDEGLVDYLVDKNYLSQPVECPHQGDYSLDEQGQVVCDHE